MNNKDIDNHTLNKRIDNFKKRYNELLLELDSSSFLNISKFTNSDWLEANHDESLSSLLEENDQVNRNLQLIKNSIKEKLKNLELLSQKSKGSSVNHQEYIQTYEDLIENERNSFNDYASNSMNNFRVYDDIERTISKIDRIKDYIEDKVLGKIEESEQEKIELRNILNSLNDRIKTLVDESTVSNQIIQDLQYSNEQLQIECDKAIELWMGLNSKLDNLELLIDENDDHVKLINNEKDKLISQLESKINDLLFEKSKSETVYNDSLTETYLSNASDIFLESIHKIFFDTIQDIFALENKLGAKNKIFKQNAKDLIVKIDEIHATKHLVQNSIMDINEHHVFEWTNDLNEFVEEFENVTKVVQIENLFKTLYIEKIEEVKKKFENLSSIIWELQENFRENFNNKSIKKINSIISEVESYNAKVNLFEEQINLFIENLNDYSDLEISSSILNEQYWANLALFFKKLNEDVDSEFKAIFDIRNIFFSYLLPKFKLVKKNYIDVESQYDNDENVQPNMDDTNSSVENESIEDTSDNIINFSENNISDIELNDNSLMEEKNPLEDIKTPDVIMNDLMNKYDNQTNSQNLITLETNSFSISPTQNSPINLNDVVNIEKQKVNTSENINLTDTSTSINIDSINENVESNKSIQNNQVDLTNFDDGGQPLSLVPQEFVNEQQTLEGVEPKIIDIINKQQEQQPSALIDSLNVESNNDESEKSLNLSNNVLSNDVVDDINEYVQMCDANGTLEDQKLEKLINDKTQPLYEKIDNIEKILYKLLENKDGNFNDNLSNNSFLIQKKYNKNLKLRLIKSKLYHIKLMIEAEKDNKYLEIIKRLEE